MPLLLKLGKRPAVVDTRVKRLSVAAPKLPAPPLDANWYADIPEWYMLGNNSLGDCVEAAVLHCILQFSKYAGEPLLPTEAEAISFYEGATGYTPANPSTDQGSYVLGNNGVMQYWTNNGVICGGKLNKVDTFVQITKKNPVEWMQAIHLFGGMLVGLQLPEAIVAGDTVPDVWRDYAGEVAGGHEVWICGFETLNSGRYYNLVSWGQLYKATEEFLLHCIDEVVVVIDPAEINARGVDGADIKLVELMTDIKILGA